MKTRSKIFSVFAVTLFAGYAMADVVEITVLSEPAPNVADATTYTLLLTTDDDVVSYEDMTLTVQNGTVFNLGLPFGADTKDPSILFGMFDPLTFDDTFVTTPGDTNVLVNDGTDPIQPTGIPLSTWADFSDNGPQVNHVMARITLINDASEAMATGELITSVALAADPANPIRVVVPLVPEPSTAVLAGLAGLLMLVFRRGR